MFRFQGVYSKIQSTLLSPGGGVWDLRWALKEMNCVMNSIEYPTYTIRVCRSLVDNKLYTATERR